MGSLYRSAGEVVDLCESGMWHHLGRMVAGLLPVIRGGKSYRVDVTVRQRRGRNATFAHPNDFSDNCIAQSRMKVEENLGEALSIRATSKANASYVAGLWPKVFWVDPVLAIVSA